MCSIFPITRLVLEYVYDIRDNMAQTDDDNLEIIQPESYMVAPNCPLLQ